MTTGRAIEPVAAVFTLRIGKTLLLFTLRALAIHFAVGDIFLEEQSTLGAHLGITAVIWSLATRRRANVNRVTGVTPVFASRHLFAYRTFFHHNTLSHFTTANTVTGSSLKIINLSQNFQHVISKLLKFQGHAQRKKPGC